MNIVLFKLKPGVGSAAVLELTTAVESMMGKVPGLQKIVVGPPHRSTAFRAQGFDLGVIATLNKAETIKIYAEHPEHLKLSRLLDL
jgi:hypothetical protein